MGRNLPLWPTGKIIWKNSPISRNSGRAERRRLTNDAVTLPSCSVASRGGEHSKIIQEHHFYSKIYQENKHVIDFDPFFGHDRDLTPPQVPLLGGSWDSLRM